MDDRPPRYADCGLLRCSAGYHVFPVHQTHTEEGEKAGNAIEVGDSIITNSGFYGKVVDTTYDTLIVEFGLNRGIRIPVAKTEVFGKAEPNMSNEAPPVEEEPKKKGLFRRG